MVLILLYSIKNKANTVMTIAIGQIVESEYFGF